MELIVEPVNRYEVNFINNCAEGLEIVRRAGRRCVKLMPDLFHMNIEDASFRQAFESARDYIGYVHVADSNRLAPGWGHLPFDEIFRILSDIRYDGYITAEILPKPDAGSRRRAGDPVLACPTGGAAWGGPDYSAAGATLDWQ